MAKVVTIVDVINILLEHGWYYIPSERKCMRPNGVNGFTWSVDKLHDICTQSSIGSLARATGEAMAMPLENVPLALASMQMTEDHEIYQYTIDLAVQTILQQRLARET